MSKTFNNEVLAHDGMGITSGDFNDAQRFLRALTIDQMWGPRCRVEQVKGWSDAILYAIEPLAGVVTNSVTALQVKNSAIYSGLIGQFRASPDGLTPQLLLYRLDGGEISVTLPPGGTNPRYDRICVQLNYADDDLQTRDYQDDTTTPPTLTTQNLNVKRRVLLSIQVVSGTPGPSPAVPAVPAGWALWATVSVVAGKTTAFTLAELHDHRIPIGFGSQIVLARDCLYLPSQWTYDATACTLTSTGVASLYAPLTMGMGYVTRYLGYAGLSNNLTGAVQLAIMTHQVGNVTNFNNLISGGVASDFTVAETLPPKFAAWGGGGFNPLQYDQDPPQRGLCLIFFAGAAGQIFHGIRIDYAGGHI